MAEAIVGKWHERALPTGKLEAICELVYGSGQPLRKAHAVCPPRGDVRAAPGVMQ